MGTAQDALNVFRSWVAQGIRENPPGSNRTPIGVEFGWNGVAWCAEAVSVALKRTGTPGLWSASCYELIDVLRRQGRWQGANRPQVGALAFYSSGAFPSGGAHVNIVESISGGRMACIGGNESDSVRRSIRSVVSSYGFGLPAYTNAPAPTPIPPKPPEDDVPERGVLVDVVMNPNGSGQGYVLDRSGGVHALNGAPVVASPASWPGKDIARKLIIASWSPPNGWVADCTGALHAFGGAPAVTSHPSWPLSQGVDYTLKP